MKKVLIEFILDRYQRFYVSLILKREICSCRIKTWIKKQHNFECIKAYHIVIKGKHMYVHEYAFGMIKISSVYQVLLLFC